MDRELLGVYSEDDNTISIGIEHLETSNSISVLESLCHEVRHCYQHSIVLEYENADTASKRLLIYKDAAGFKQEFDNYEDLSKNKTDYFTMKCESDAREYAHNAVTVYQELIKEYLKKNTANDS